MRILALRKSGIALASAAAVAACGAGGVRPGFDPFPQAELDTVSATPDAVTSVIGELLAAERIEVRYLRLNEGYVETKWFDVNTARTVSSLSLDTDSTVRIRFWVNPASPTESEVLGEAAKRRVIDPSLPERETEQPVPTDHPGADLVRRIMARLVALVSGQSAEHR